MMLSTANLLSPADGSPVVAPTQDMVLGCYYLTMDADSVKRPKRDPDLRHRRTRRSSPTSCARRPARRSTSSIDVEVRAWDAETGDAPARAAPDDHRPGHLQPDPARPAPLPRHGHAPGATSRSSSTSATAQLGPEETAHLVDGIKSVGFEFATRGGMTIGLFDIEIPKDKPARLKAADDSVAAIDRQFQRGLITEDERYEQVVGVWQETTRAMSDEMMKLARPERPGHDDDRVRRPREQGQHRPAGRDARPDGRPVRPDHRRPRPEQLPRGDDRPRVLHLHPRRPQGPRRHRPAHGRLRVPHPAPGRRRPGRHHPRGGLRHRGGQLDHPRASRATRRAPSRRRLVGRLAAAPLPDPRGQGQEGRGADRCSSTATS